MAEHKDKPAVGGPGPHHPSAAGEKKPADKKKPEPKDQVRVAHNTVGRFAKGDILPAGVFGDDLDRLVEIGALEFTDDDATVHEDLLGKPVKERIAEAPKAAKTDEGDAEPKPKK